MSGIGGDRIAQVTALLHASLSPLLVLSMVFIASSGRFRAKYAAWAIVGAVCFLLPYLCLAAWVGPELRQSEERLPAGWHLLLSCGSDKSGKLKRWMRDRLPGVPFRTLCWLA